MGLAQQNNTRSSSRDLLIKAAKPQEGDSLLETKPVVLGIEAVIEKPSVPPEVELISKRLWAEEVRQRLKMLSTGSQEYHDLVQVQLNREDFYNMLQDILKTMWPKPS
jgi:hypothetical protein